MANKRGMRPEHARHVKDQTPDDGERRRSPDGSANLFARRGDSWQTMRDSLKEFGVETCPCCGQAVNPEMDQFTRATRAKERHPMGPDKPVKPRTLVADDDTLKANIAIKLAMRLRKLGVK